MEEHSDDVTDEAGVDFLEDGPVLALLPDVDGGAETAWPDLERGPRSFSFGGIALSRGDSLGEALLPAATRGGPVKGPFGSQTA